MPTKTRLPLFVSIILVLLLFSGCSILPINKDVEERISNLTASSILVNTDEIRPQTIDLIDNAKEAIYIQLSALDDSQILDLLMKKSQEGLDIRILLDQWQRDNSSTVRTLKNNNVSVQYYPSQKGQYQKVRYLVVDYNRAMFYQEDWTSKGFSSYHIAVELTGDTAWKMTKSFEKDWQYTTTLALNLPDKMDLPEENITFATNANIKQQILRYIDSSQTEIKVIVEQLSDADTVDALLLAKTRGIDIKLILSPATIMATPNTIKRLEEAQINIRYNNHPEEKPLMLNFGIFDDKTFIITSSPWTYYTFIINHECSLTIPSPEVVIKMNSIFDQEWNNGTTEP